MSKESERTTSALSASPVILGSLLLSLFTSTDARPGQLSIVMHVLAVSDENGRPTATAPTMYLGCLGPRGTRFLCAVLAYTPRLALPGRRNVLNVEGEQPNKELQIHPGV